MRLENYVKNNESVNTILEYCKPWFDYCNKQRVKNKFLWRGSSHNIKTYTRLKNRRKRYPIDTCDAVHDMADEFFYKIFNIKARSETLFCFPDIKHAMYYSIYQNIVLPIGKFNYIWSPEISDFFSYMADEFFYKIICDESIINEYYENEYGEESGNGTWYYEETDTETEDKYEAIEIVKNWKLENGEITEEDLEKNPLSIESKINNDLGWNPEVSEKDYYDQKVRESIDELYNNIKYNYIKNEKFKDLMDNFRYKNNEIMLDCNYYYIINKDWAEEFLS